MLTPLEIITIGTKGDHQPRCWLWGLDDLLCGCTEVCAWISKDVGNLIPCRRHQCPFMFERPTCGPPVNGHFLLFFLFINLYDWLHVRRSNFKPHLVWFILRPTSQLVCSLNELEIVAPWHVLSTSICRNYRHCLSNIIAIQTLILFWYNCYVTRQWKCTLTVHADIFVNMHVLCPRMMEVACIHVATTMELQINRFQFVAPRNNRSHR